MAATGFTPIQLYRTSTAAAVPTSGNLADGELAINLTDERLYFKNAAGTVKLLAANITPVANGGTGSTTLAANNVLLGNGTSAFQVVAPGTAGNVLTSNGTTWTSAAGATVSAATPTALGTVYARTNDGSSYQTFLGYQAGNVNTGTYNAFVGYRTGLANTSGARNVALGAFALDSNITGDNSVAIGYSALSGVTANSGSIAIGYNAGYQYTGANRFIAIGDSAFSNTGGMVESVGIGTSVGTSMTSGQWNTFVGDAAASGRTAGTSNTALGRASLTAGTGDSNTAVGSSAMGRGNVTTAANHVAVGHEASFSATSANNSTAVGFRALREVTTGGNNAALGYESGDQLTTGIQNVILGVGAASSGTNDLTTGSNNIIIGYQAEASSASVSNEVTIGNTSIVSTRLRGMVELNAAMFEAANISATAATGTINFDARTQSVLYYTSNASGNWTLNIRAASGVSLDSVMTTGESMTVAFLVTNGATAYYQTGFQVDGTSITPRWQGGTAPTAGNASSIDTYVITVIKTGSAAFTVLASQTKFA